MSSITEDLKHRISTLPDEDLLKMVSAERANYREETVNFAEEQLQARQIPFEKLAERTEPLNSEKPLFSIYTENDDKGSNSRDRVGILCIVGWTVLSLAALMSPIDTRNKITSILVSSVLSVLYYKLSSREKHE